MLCRKKIILHSLFICCVFVMFLAYASSTNDHCIKGTNNVDCDENAEVSRTKYSPTKQEDSDHGGDKRTDTTVHLAVVACGDRLEETLIMIKSAMLFTKVPVHVHIFAEDDLKAQFKTKLESWPTSVRRLLTYSIHSLQFPADQNEKAWKKLFKPCASQRLFIPDLLVNVDALLYVDTDILFLRPPEDVWEMFNDFNDSQLAALAPEHEEPSASWYKRFARHPYVPPYGINSGVMLMNLTRMRSVKWLNDIIKYYNVYRYNITWGDQDLINIFFHFYPERLHQFPCYWNYRPDHCMYMSTCKQAEQKGVSVLHGCRSVFHNDKQPVFKVVYETLRDYQFGDDLKLNLLNKINQKMKVLPARGCGSVSYVFTKQLKNQVVR